MGKNSFPPFHQIERWSTIFPAYLNKKKTVAEGRRIPKEKAVENPNITEIAEVMKAKGFQVWLNTSVDLHFRFFVSDPDRSLVVVQAQSVHTCSL